ncbi:MAG: hypothetical protein GX978_05910 [Tissierellia bacterium]|nr:hypothetical protein [Tissierellia bacterium]
MYVDETFRHFKPIWTFGPGKDYVAPEYAGDPGVQLAEPDGFDTFIDHLTKHRFWDRPVE